MRLDPVLADGFSALGAALRISENSSGAIPAFRRALALKPDDVEARNGLAKSYESIGNFNSAIAELEKAVEIDPLWVLPLTNLTDDYTLLGRTDKALAVAKRFRAISPDAADADMLDGLVAYSAGQYGKSLNLNDAALARNPKLANAVISRMWALVQLLAADRITASDWKNAAAQFLPREAYAGNWSGLAALVQDKSGGGMPKTVQLDALALAFAQLERPADLVRAFDARFANVTAFASPDANLGTALKLASAFEAVGRAGDARALRDFVRAGLTRLEANGVTPGANAMAWATLLTAEGDRFGALTRLERDYSVKPMSVCSNDHAIWIGDYRPLAPLFGEPRFAAIKARCRDEINKQRKVAGLPPAVFKQAQGLR